MKDNNPQNPSPSVKASVEFFTVQKAQELLGSNTPHQRSIAATNQKKIESDLINGRWQLNGEAIIISKTGKLLDGQHRLLACMNTKVGFWSVVSRGVEDECFNLINIGKGRSLADVLKIAGEKNCANLAATLGRLGEYVRDSASVGSRTSASISAPEAFDLLATMPSVRDSVAANCFISSGEVMSCGRIAWLHCLAYDENPEAAEVFFPKLQTGELLKSDSPIYMLRARMIADKQSKAKLPTREVLALLVKSWNAFISEKPTKQLRWSQDEPFPILDLKGVK